MQQHHTQHAVQAEMQNEKKTIPVVFRYPALAKDKEALLTGSFNNWKEKVPMVKRFVVWHIFVEEIEDSFDISSDNDFVVILELPEGEHEYKFLIDGRWEYDLNEVWSSSSLHKVCLINLLQASKDDGLNGRNNVVTVKKSDFEVMEALISDSIPANSQNQNLNKQQCKGFFEVY